MTPSVLPPPPTLHALTGLRFIAAIHVVLYHYGRRAFEDSPKWLYNIIDAGYIGVSLFYILSGFIITYVYLDAQGQRKVDARKFWAARFARIYPVYLLGLLLWLPFFLGKVRYEHLSPFTTWGTAFTAPLALQAWFPNTACVWNCPAWSVSVEAFFYLLFPWLAVAFVPRIRTATAGQTASLLAGLWVLSLLPPLAYMIAESAGGAERYHTWLNAVKFSPIARFPEFLMGIVLGKFFLTRLAAGRRDERLGGVMVGASLLALILLLVNSPSLPYPLLHNGLLAPLFIVLIYGLSTGRGPVIAGLSLPAMVLLGEISFALYVLHAPIWDWMHRLSVTLRIPIPAGSAAVLLVYLLLLTLASFLTFRFLEAPARDVLRARLAGPARRAPAPGAADKVSTAAPPFRFGRVASFAAGIAVGMAVLGLVVYPLTQRSRSTAGPVVQAANGEEPVYGNLLQAEQLQAGLEEAGWTFLAGQWGFENSAITQTDTEGYDRLLLGTGVYQAPYVLRTGFRVIQGSGAGVVFNAPSQEVRAGAHMVRYSDDGAGVFWGYFDEAGDFQGQGFAQTLPPQKAVDHVLQVEVADGAYSITLDGRVLASRVPLQSPAGHVGLATSLSSAAFTSLEVVKPSEATPAAGGPEGTAGSPPVGAEPAMETGDFRADFTRPPEEAGWQVIAGEWAAHGGTYVETQEEGYDQVLLYERPFTAPFTLSATFANLTGSGGGVVFGAPEGEGRTGRHLVRYGDDRMALTWGYFNKQRDFVGQGSASTQPPGTGEHALQVRVGEQAYSVTLDGQTLAENVPLQSPSGRAGLQSSVGTVAFKSFEVERER